MHRSIGGLLRVHVLFEIVGEIWESLPPAAPDEKAVDHMSSALFQLLVGYLPHVMPADWWLARAPACPSPPKFGRAAPGIM